MTRLAFNLDAQSKLNLANYKVSIDNFCHPDVFLQEILRCFAKYYFYLWWENSVNSAKYECQISRSKIMRLC